MVLEILEVRANIIHKLVNVQCKASFYPKSSNVILILYAGAKQQLIQTGQPLT